MRRKYLKEFDEQTLWDQGKDIEEFYLDIDLEEELLGHIFGSAKDIQYNVADIITAGQKPEMPCIVKISTPVKIDDDNLDETGVFKGHVSNEFLNFIIEASKLYHEGKDMSKICWQDGGGKLVVEDPKDKAKEVVDKVEETSDNTEETVDETEETINNK